MANSAQGIRWRRLLVAKDSVTSLESRRASVQVALENAQHAYSSALAVMRELEAELSDINEEHRSATSRFQAVRDAYRREALARLPDDIVRHIFEHARPFRENIDFMDMRPGYFGSLIQKTEDIMLPFSLASVCRQWRSVALGMSTLWSFVVVWNTSRAHLERVRLLLERSKSAPLDVVFDLDEGQCSEIREAMLSALQEHTWRWKRIHQTRIVLPADFALIRRQAPQLRGLFINVETAAVAGPPPDSGHHNFWLSPQIEQLVLISPTCPIVPRAPYVLPSLVSLLWSHPGAHILWEIIHAARDTLKDVVFAPVPDAAEILPPQNPPRPFTLRNLEQLHIHALGSGAPQFNMLKAPRLKILSIQNKGLAIMVAPFLEAVGTSVTTLVIHSALGRDAVGPFAKLSNVEHLVFSQATTIFTPTYNVSDAFFADLSAPVDVAGAESPVWYWPKLSTITLSTRGTFEAGTGQHFLQLVRTRTGADLDDRSTPRRLTRVVIEDKASPAWLRDEVRLILK